MEGRKNDAIKMLHERLSCCGEQESVRKTRLLATLVAIHIIELELDQAIAANHQLHNIATRHGYSYAKEWSLYFYGLIHFYKNDLDQAIGYFQKAEENRYAMHAWAAIDSMIGLALAYQSRGMPDRASAALQELKDYVIPLNDPAYSMIAQSCQMRLSIMAGELKSDMSWCPQNIPATENMFV